LLGESVYDRYVTRKDFFTSKDGKWAINRKAIDDHVERVYIEPVSNPAYRSTAYAYEGPPEIVQQVVFAKCGTRT
jgi:hypothetical protein